GRQAACGKSASAIGVSAEATALPLGDGWGATTRGDEMTAFAEPETSEQTLPGTFLWMRAGAKRHYVGDVELDPYGLSLLGHENSLSIEALIRIPFAEVQCIRPSSGDAEAVAGVPGVV